MGYVLWGFELTLLRHSTLKMEKIAEKLQKLPKSAIFNVEYLKAS